MDLTAHILVIVQCSSSLQWGSLRRRTRPTSILQCITLDAGARIGRHWLPGVPPADHAVLLLGGGVLILVSGAAAYLLARSSRTQARTLVPVVMFNNCGNMGLPLALLAFGPENFGAAVALFSISNLIHFSLGARITSTHARTRDLLMSPLMIATALGFASAASGVRPPEVLFTGLKIMGEAMLPLMLFALGVRLTDLQRQEPRPRVPCAAIGLAIALPLGSGTPIASEGSWLRSARRPR
jgi:predicted permease